MKIRIKTSYLKTFFLLTGILVGCPLIAQENGGGGLGSVSSCPATPEIAASAVTFAFTPQSGLNGAQSAALIRNIVHQASISAPYLPAQIAAACVQAISRSATATVVSGQGLPNSTSAEVAKSTTAQKSITTTEGYKEAIASITQGAISGSANSVNDISTLIKVCTAIAVELVKDSAEQAEVAANMKRAGTLSDTSEPPINDVQNGVAVAKAFVAAASSVAARLGFNPQEVAQVINTAGTAAVDAAGKIGQLTGGITGQPAGQAAGQAAQQSPGQVAYEVAEAFALQITASTDTKSTQQGQQTQQTQNNSQNAPNPTEAGLPGESQNPFVGPPPIPQPSPTPNPSPTPTPTPVPTPTPPSSGGLG